VAEPVWLDRDIVTKMHEWCLAAWGGTGGIRDGGLLDSALSRPQTIYDYRPEVTIHELAADGRDSELVATIIALAAGDITQERLAVWIRQNSE